MLMCWLSNVLPFNLTQCPHFMDVIKYTIEYFVVTGVQPLYPKGRKLAGAYFRAEYKV